MYPILKVINDYTQIQNDIKTDIETADNQIHELLWYTSLFLFFALIFHALNTLKAMQNKIFGSWNCRSLQTAYVDNR